MLDADRALLLARATCRALPQDALVIHIHQLPVSLARQESGFVLQDDGLGIEPLSRAERRTIVLASSTLHAREGIEDRLRWQVFHRLEAHLLFLEIKIGHRA